MNIESRRVCGNLQVTASTDNATINSGLLDEKEATELAGQMIAVVWELGTGSYYECRQWFADLLKQANIELPQEETEQ
jgi:hypothetical protein